MAHLVEAATHRERAETLRLRADSNQQPQTLFTEGGPLRRTP